MTGRVHLQVSDSVASIVFDRPEARNAMTWAMYDELQKAVATIKNQPSVRAALLRGAGGWFVAGTDITQFAAFDGAKAGLDYEARIESGIAAIEALPVPTIAVVEGPAMGGGLMIATACDLRIATPDARFGAPIARTVGNCLSLANMARLAAAFGDSRARRLLLLAETLEAEEALACGFLTEIVEPEALGQRALALASKLSGHAPITMRASKEALRRLRVSRLSDDSDLIAAVYGSRDFAEGVVAFGAKRRPEWKGH